MDGERITYSDVAEYESLFTLAPSFVLERFAKKNTNLVEKFKPIIQSYMGNLTPEQKNKLDIILKTDTGELQSIMRQSYKITGKKQFKVLGDERYKGFIEDNLGEIRDLITV